MLFQHTIDGWDSWGQVHHDLDAWQPLVAHILVREGFPAAEVALLPPGTNAVLSAGDVVVKIFAPEESRKENPTYSESKYRAELFGLRHAAGVGVRAPRLLAAGEVADAYRFRYLVMERIAGEPFKEAEKRWNDAQKLQIGRQLRAMANALNIPCADFGAPDVAVQARTSRQWADFPDSFQRERLAYLDTLPAKEQVYVHGDMHPGNLMVAAGGQPVLLDFADSVIAATDYEWAMLVYLEFAKPYMEGFCGAGFDTEEVADKCLRGLLVHPYWGWDVPRQFGPAADLTELDVLRQRICKKINDNR